MESPPYNSGDKASTRKGVSKDHADNSDSSNMDLCEGDSDSLSSNESDPDPDYVEEDNFNKGSACNHNHKLNTPRTPKVMHVDKLTNKD